MLLFCPTCGSGFSTSLGVRSTLIGGGFGTVKDGIRHFHDPDVYTELFNCSNKHLWKLSYTKECPAPHCMHGVDSTAIEAVDR